jgi:hypothetical protein
MTILRFCGIALAAGVLTVAAETPNLSGVWKADLEKSTFPGRGPKPSNYLMIVDQSGAVLKETIGLYNQFGEQRTYLTFNTRGKQTLNWFHGVPMRSTVAWNDGVLTVDSKIAGAHAQTVHETYTAGADGNSLTIETKTSGEHGDMQQTLLLTKQPAEAGEPLRKPEVTAGEKYKNVQVLKALPASAFIDTMRNFTMSLGQDCEFCHVEHDFASDQKDEKKTARKMITMTSTANEQTFSGRTEVRCYTCHRGAKEPVSIPE